MPDKKLFSPEDFDKDKQLFGPEDFDKEPREPKGPGLPPGPGPDPGPKSKRWIWWAVAAAVVVVAGGVWYFAARDNGGSQQTDEPPIAVATADSAENDTSAEGTAMQEGGDVAPDSTLPTGNAGQTAEAEPAAPANDKPAAKAADKQPAAATATPTGDIEDTAMNVIRGNYGNGNVRKQNLGDKYQTIQNRVNQLKREGAF